MAFPRLVVLLFALAAYPAWAIEPFVIKDIRVEGIQRTEAGTVFSYLPVKVGDTMTDEKASQAIRALFATGFFRDVTLEVDNGVLVVVVQERPSVAQIDFAGMREFNKDQVLKGLRQVGLDGGAQRRLEGEEPVCGNGGVETGEGCDDGNTAAGDGCSPACQVEPPVCGNGRVETGEQCDDGNTAPGDAGGAVAGAGVCTALGVGVVAGAACSNNPQPTSQPASVMATTS